MALLHKWSSKSQELRAAGEYINFSVLWSKFWTALWRETCPYLLQKLDILFSSNLSFRCPNDVTVQYHSSPSVSAQRFSLEAFKFIAGHPFVFVHCHVTVCNATDLDSQCVQTDVLPVAEENGRQVVKWLTRTFWQKVLFI